jgi:mRNA-degrading endonuclease YafQ of YafQ-DinJ toxin-antitoxin module
VAKSKYQLQIDNQAINEDFPMLPIELLEDFANVIKPLLQLDPLNCCGTYSSHALLGKLQGYRALEIDFDKVYRLVYRIYEKPAPPMKMLSDGKSHKINAIYSLIPSRSRSKQLQLTPYVIVIAIVKS